MSHINRVRARSVLTGSAATIAMVWAWWVIDPTAPTSPWLPSAISLLLIANVFLTIRRPRTKRALVAALQRYVLNPLVRVLFRIGFVPFGYVLLETVGRRTGRARRTPVGDGMDGDVCWIVAEHGATAGYVRNVLANPRVRLQVRSGYRFVWRTGTATVLPDDNPLQRQRLISRRRPLRLLNAMVVRTLGTDLLTVRIDLDPQVLGPLDPPYRQHRNDVVPMPT